MSDEEDYEYEYTDDEDGDDGNAMDVSDTQPRAVRKMSGVDVLNDDKDDGIRMLPSGELKSIMDNHVKEAVEVLGVPACAAAILLREHKWAKERLFQSFFDNPEKVKEKCGVLARCQSPGASGEGNPNTPPTRSTRSTAKPQSRKHCEICLDEDGFDDDEMIRMPCGHEFCETCWYGYISNAMEKGPVCVRESCPESGCKELITEEEVARAAPDLLPKFEGYQLRSFVDTNGSTRWCPGPGCDQVALASGSGGAFADAEGVAKCTGCKTCFCLRCGEEPHAPIGCKDLEKWAVKLADESETANWILANSKPCPKCSTRIEKNQGCNHMTCRSCKHEFCWICMGNWNDHGANTGGYYKCNKFDPNKDDSNDQSSAAKAKRELDRYLHYYKRYHGHAQAEDFARKSVKKTEERMIELQEQNSETAWTDVEFLKAANEQLVECRRVLKYTYAHAFYLQEGDNREMFEYHQEMLERFTENLSELSEKPLQEINRTEVVNQTRVVGKFMDKLLQYVESGDIDM
ncbi:hypothetical protein ACHAXT_007433 [Thalassiosira profunda]